MRMGVTQSVAATERDRLGEQQAAWSHGGETGGSKRW